MSECLWYDFCRDPTSHYHLQFHVSVKFYLFSFAIICCCENKNYSASARWLGGDFISNTSLGAD